MCTLWGGHISSKQAHARQLTSSSPAVRHKASERCVTSLQCSYSGMHASSCAPFVSNVYTCKVAMWMAPCKICDLKRLKRWQ